MRDGFEMEGGIEAEEPLRVVDIETVRVEKAARYGVGDARGKGKREERFGCEVCGREGDWNGRARA